MTTSPSADAPTVLVTAVGGAEGSRGAAAALACAGADLDLATLLVDLGGRPPRPGLLATAAAQRLEERLRVHLPQTRVAARGQVCQLAVPATPEGLEAASAAVTVARGALAVVHLPPAQLQPLLEESRAPDPSGVLLRADIGDDRALLALVVQDLIARDLDVVVLKHRLRWVTERRALFGALPPGASDLPRIVRRRLLSESCYIQPDGTGSDQVRAGQPERRDHAESGSW